MEEFRVGALEGVAWSAPEAQAATATVRAWAGGDLSRRWPGAESGEEVVARFVAALAELADRHRGETVLVVSHGGVMTLGITHTAVNVAPEARTQLDLPNTAVADGGDRRGRVAARRPLARAGVDPGSRAPQNRRDPTSSMPRSAS